MSRFPLRFLALVALCSACGDSPDPWIAAQEQWFERVEFAGRADTPEFLIVWDGNGPVRSRLVDSVQFALWSDGVAVWRGNGEGLEPVLARADAALYAAKAAGRGRVQADPS